MNIEKTNDKKHSGWGIASLLFSFIALCMFSFMLIQHDSPSQYLLNTLGGPIEFHEMINILFYSSIGLSVLAIIFSIQGFIHSRQKKLFVYYGFLIALGLLIAAYNLYEIGKSSQG